MSPPILIVAHPGHELRLFGWINVARPLVCILTDGSGGRGASRTRYSKDVLTASGCSAGPVMGELSDRAWYDAILTRNIDPFVRAADAISAVASANALVVSDPVEGYNPMHDLCAALADRVADDIGGTRMAYQLMYPRGDGDVLGLSAETEVKKRAAIRAYKPIAKEAAQLLREDARAMIEERLVADCFTWPEELDAKPKYEQFGDSRIEAGVYAQTIRYAQHVRPIALHLRTKGR